MADSSEAKKGNYTLSFDFPKLPEFKIPPLPPNPFIQNMEANYASEFYKRLVKWIRLMR